MNDKLRAAMIGEAEAQRIANWAGGQIETLQTEVGKWKKRHTSVCVALLVLGIYAGAVTMVLLGFITRVWK